MWQTLLSEYGKIKNEARDVVRIFSPLTDSNIRGIEMAKKILPNRNPLKKICSVENCPMLVRSRDLCNRHYTMLLRRGTTVEVHKHGVGKTPEERFWSRVDKTPGLGKDGECWEWQGHLKKGYGAVHFEKQRHRATHVAFYLETGRWPVAPLLRHTCDNPPCVNPAHLLEGTPQDNANDALSRNRVARGASHGMAVVSESDVKEILLSREPVKKLAVRYGIKPATVQKIKGGRSWKHVVVNADI